MNKKGFVKILEAVIASSILIGFSIYIVSTSPGFFERQGFAENLSGSGIQALKVMDDAIYKIENGTQISYMRYYLENSNFSLGSSDPYLREFYETLRNALPENVSYKLIIEGKSFSGTFEKVEIGPDPPKGNIMSSHYIKPIGGYFQISGSSNINVLAAVDDQIDIDFLWKAKLKAEEIYPGLSVSIKFVDIRGMVSGNWPDDLVDPNTNSILLTGRWMPGTGSPPRDNFNDLMESGIYSLFVLEDIDSAHIPPGQVWTEYLQTIRCIGNSPTAGERGLLVGAQTIYHVYSNPGVGWNTFADILGIEKQTSGPNPTKIVKIPQTASSNPPDPNDPTQAFVRSFGISNYHFIMKDFIVGDILRHNDLFLDAFGNPIFHPTSRPATWDDDTWNNGLFTIYVNYDQTSLPYSDREMWYEVASHQDIAGTWNPDSDVINDNMTAIAKNVFPYSAEQCAPTNINECGRFPINFIRMGHSWWVYMDYYSRFIDSIDPQERDSAIYALKAAEDLETIMAEEILWGSFWDVPYEFKIYKITLLVWYGGYYE